MDEGYQASDHGTGDRHFSAESICRSATGKEHVFFAGMAGIFGHGNVAGIGQALQQSRFPYILTRNEQASVHLALGFAKMNNRLRTFACTSSIGPGATNMITGAALATINRLPVLFCRETFLRGGTRRRFCNNWNLASSQDISVNDCFKPVSRYWDVSPSGTDYYFASERCGY